MFDDMPICETKAYASLINSTTLMDCLDDGDNPSDDLLADHLASALAMSALVANGASVHASAAFAYKDTGPMTADALTRVRDAANRLLNYMASDYYKAL